MRASLKKLVYCSPEEREVFVSVLFRMQCCAKPSTNKKNHIGVTPNKDTIDFIF